MSDPLPQWSDCEVVIVASGPSLTQDDCDAVGAWRSLDAKRKVIAINTSFRRAPFADVLYACDSYWWDVYLAEVRASWFLGQLWTQDSRAVEKYGIKFINSQRGKGLSKVPGLIHQGGNSGFQSINFAYQAGARHIALLGFDMKAAERTHWHEDHPQGLNPRPFFETWIVDMKLLAADLAKEGVRVVNLTRDTALDCFPRGELEAIA